MYNKEYIWRSVMEVAVGVVIFTDAEGVIRLVNKAVTKLFGYSPSELIGEKIEILLHPDLREMHRAMFSEYSRKINEQVHSPSIVVGQQRVFPGTVISRGHASRRFFPVNKNMQEVPITVTINEVWSDFNELLGFIALILDNSEQYNLQQALHYQATHDSVTGLCNWQELTRLAAETKEQILARGEEYFASLIYLDIDYFATINRLSQRAGNSALNKAANWLLNYKKTCCYDNIILSHFIGDEFIMYLPGIAEGNALALAGDIKQLFKKLNLRTEENPFFTSLSVGVASFGRDTSFQEAIFEASSACNTAKSKGKDKVKLAQEEDSGYLRMEPVIRRALANSGIKLYAQKIIPISMKAKELGKGQPHYEILSRMEDRDGNIISPVQFIPAVEKLGLAVDMDFYVIENALLTLKNHPRHLERLAICSINLSGISVSNEDMLSFIEDNIRACGIDARKLCFEVTETYEIEDNEVALQLVRGLKSLGCKVAFDDFGIGYSNYQSFSRLPVDIIKIDGVYVQALLSDSRLRTDATGMINSAKARDLDIVAEFVENEELVAELVRLGCDYAQGYHFGKPTPLESLIAEFEKTGEIQTP